MHLVASVLIRAPLKTSRPLRVSKSMDLDMTGIQHVSFKQQDTLSAFIRLSKVFPDPTVLAMMAGWLPLISNAFFVCPFFECEDSLP